MNLKDVMDQVAGSLKAIHGLRVYPYAPDKLDPPAAVVAYPEGVAFDKTYGRGMDRLKLPVIVVAGRANARAARDNLIRWCSGSGAESVKQIIEAGTYTAFHMVRVEGIEFSAFTMAGTDYVAATFTLDIAGQGG